jgi:chromosome segregation ATPase
MNDTTAYPEPRPWRNVCEFAIETLAASEADLRERVSMSEARIAHLEAERNSYRELLQLTLAQLAAANEKLKQLRARHRDLAVAARIARAA